MIFQPQIVGKPLPTLTNPGTAADLLSGKQLIDANGNVLTGTLEEPPKLYSVNIINNSSYRVSAYGSPKIVSLDIGERTVGYFYSGIISVSASRNESEQPADSTMVSTSMMLIDTGKRQRLYRFFGEDGIEITFSDN